MQNLVEESEPKNTKKTTIINSVEYSLNPGSTTSFIAL